MNSLAKWRTVITSTLALRAAGRNPHSGRKYNRNVPILAGQISEIGSRLDQISDNYYIYLDD